MYTSYIGNKFLEIYRQRMNLSIDYTAKQFFDEVFFPLFFDDAQHLMHVGNSPFFQKPTKKAVEEHGTKSKAQLFNLHAKIEEGIPSGAIYVGYGAENVTATSSGQMTSMSLEIEDDEMYASWIGQALAAGVSGGVVMLLDEEVVLWQLFTGWKWYRKYLQQTPKLKDKQIETWNGHWLAFSFGKYYDDNKQESVYQYLEPSVVQGNLAIPTIDWVKVVFALSRKYPEQVLTAYIYTLSQTNTTYGFINLYLPKVRKLIDMKLELYSFSDSGYNDEGVESLYTTFYTLKNACTLGTIGLRALEPKELRKFMPKGTVMYAGGKDYKFTDVALKPKKNEDETTFNTRLQKAKNKRQHEIIYFQIFKNWIIAMLNNKKELNALAEQVAQALIDFENQNQDTKRGKSDKSRLSEEVQSAKSLREFVENVTKLMKSYKEGASVFKSVKDTMLELPADLFPLFVTLIRFEYQYKKSI